MQMHFPVLRQDMFEFYKKRGYVSDDLLAASSSVVHQALFSGIAGHCLQLQYRAVIDIDAWFHVSQ